MSPASRWDRKKLASIEGQWKNIQRRILHLNAVADVEQIKFDQQFMRV